MPVVTMFQPARPLLSRSSEANFRARLYGSSKVVVAVAIRPIRSVTTAMAVSRSVGSGVSAGRRATSQSSGPSAKNTESRRPRSAVRARSWK